MTLKLTAGLIILFIALALQFWFASAGMDFDFAFAALIAFAFIFDFWELLILILLAVFIINWEPKVSLTILLFAFLPIAAYFSRGTLHWQPWIENLLAIIIGLFTLYLSLAGRSFLYHPETFLIDLAGSLVFGALIFFPMYRWEK